MSFVFEMSLFEFLVFFSRRRRPNDGDDVAGSGAPKRIVRSLIKNLNASVTLPGVPVTRMFGLVRGAFSGGGEVVISGLSFFLFRTFRAKGKENN